MSDRHLVQYNYGSTARALPDLRFVDRVNGRILQQAYLIQASGANSAEPKIEWRDVPLVTE